VYYKCTLGQKINTTTAVQFIDTTV